jgi:hypothetical protein
MFAFKFALPVAFPVELTGVLWPTELVEGAWTVKERLPREIGAADERDIAGLALM